MGLNWIPDPLWDNEPAVSSVPDSSCIHTDVYLYTAGAGGADFSELQERRSIWEHLCSVRAERGGKSRWPPPPPIPSPLCKSARHSETRNSKVYRARLQVNVWLVVIMLGDLSSLTHAPTHPNSAGYWFLCIFYILCSSVRLLMSIFGRVLSLVFPKINPPTPLGRVQMAVS